MGEVLLLVQRILPTTPSFSWCQERFNGIRHLRQRVPPKVGCYLCDRVAHAENEMWKSERMLPHSCSRPLRSVIAISRLSDTWTDKTKLERLSERNEQLIQYVVDTHHKVQDERCSCNPTSHNIVLNGVSSNIVADANSALAGKTEIFRRVLDELSQTPDDGIVIVAVHSTDGLWTNIHAFMRFCPLCRDAVTGVYGP